MYVNFPFYCTSISDYSTSEKHLMVGSLWYKRLSIFWSLPILWQKTKIANGFLQQLLVIPMNSNSSSGSLGRRLTTVFFQCSCLCKGAFIIWIKVTRQLLRIICCLLLLVCFKNHWIFPDTRCTRIISGKNCSDRFTSGLYSLHLLEVWDTLQVSTDKMVLILRGKLFHPFSDSSLWSLISVIQCLLDFCLVPVLFFLNWRKTWRQSLLSCFDFTLLS